MNILADEYSFESVSKSQVEKDINLDEIVNENLYNVDFYEHEKSMSESYEDLYNIMESLYNIDMCEFGCQSDVQMLKESGRGYLIDNRLERYEVALEGAIKDGFNSIIEFFRKAAAKIASATAGAFKLIMDVSTSGKKLAEKYKDGEGEVTVTGYIYKLNEVFDHASSASHMLNHIVSAAKKGGNGYNLEVLCMKSSAEELKEYSKNIKESMDDIKLRYINSIFGSLTKELKMDQFDRMIHAHFRAGKEKPEELKYSMKDACKELLDSDYSAFNTIKKDAGKDFIEAQNSATKFSGAMKKESDKAKASAIMAMCNTVCTACNALMGLYMKFLSGAVKAAKEKEAFLKTVILKCASKSGNYGKIKLKDNEDKAKDKEDKKKDNEVNVDKEDVEVK